MTLALVGLRMILTALTIQAEELSLYLITGTATPKRNDNYSSTLLRIKEDSTVELVETLLAPATGLEWVGVSDDRRKSVLVPKSTPPHSEREIVVVDFDKGTAVKKCKPPYFSDVSSVVKQWLSDLPGGGLFYEQYLVGEDLSKAKVQRMSLDAWVPCGQSFGFAEPSEVKYISASGTAGIAGMGSTSGLLGSVEETRRVRIPVDGNHYSLGYEIPLSMRRSQKPDIVPVVINNSKLLVICVRQGDSGPCTDTVLRKRDRSWRHLPNTGETSQLRAFGHFIGVVELYRKTDPSQRSAGSEEWRKQETPTGPNQVDWFEEEARDVVYPGRLHLYNAETERVYTIVTKQADSEILLVEDDTVYYRICDRLYAAPIMAKGLGEARLLAKAEEVRDAHWAFIKRD